MPQRWNELRTAAHAWQLRTDRIAPEALRERCLSWLGADERARLEALRTDRLRHEYLAAHALCRATLSWYANADPRDWRFENGAHGKPKIVAPAIYKSLRFNLTRTGGLVICLVSRAGEVGVDAEETSRDVDVEQMVRHFFSSREQARLAQLSEPERTTAFFEQWVLKESYVKGTGRGLAAAPERLTIERDKSGRPAAIGDWRFTLHKPSPRHVAAAAIHESRALPPIPVRWLEAEALFETGVAVVG